MDSEQLKAYLKTEGATIVGVGDLTRFLAKEITHLGRGISLAINKGLTQDAIERLLKLQRLTEAWLKDRGFRSLSVPPDSDRIKGKYIARLYHLVSHKTAATCAGLGWIGKNGLVINSDYGSKLSWATVLTDAPFWPDSPYMESKCGDCDLCVKYCPSGAVQGLLWSRQAPEAEIVVYKRCLSLKKKRHVFEEKPNCGLCVTICPYSRKKQVKAKVRGVKTGS
ncbi:MAG: epoxyqueuosine reductase [Nitrospirae bacterium]|nr:epoxyqueuosine reductase [Nitrospirota bacterium]